MFLFLPLALTGGPIITSVAVRGTDLAVNLETQVGREFDPDLIDKDVRQLWSTGRFEDIRVESDADGSSVVFQVVPAPDLRLRQIRVEPSSYMLRLALPEGTLMNRVLVHGIVEQARRQLVAQGYLDAQVDSALVPCGGNRVDLRLTVKAKDPVKVKEVDFVGDLAMEPDQLRHVLRATRIRHVLRWRLFPGYSAEGVDVDLARVLSLYLSKGYFDASVRLDDTQIQGSDARLRVLVNSGPRYDAGAGQIHDICSNLLAERRDAERQGILDFSATMHVPDMTTEIERGQPYRVGRIDFIGNRHFKDPVIRKNLLLDEGELLDPFLLRKSLARLNQANLFERLDERSVAIQTNPQTGEADLKIRLTERKRGSWSLSGPVGPASIGGPLQASLSARVATYTVSISLLAFANPIVPILGVASKTGFLPVLGLQRPYMPGEGWKSGFMVAPQLGWQATVLSYATTQLKQRLLPVLAGDRGLVPELPVTVERSSGEAVMFCEPPQPRFARLRNIAALGLQLLASGLI